MDFQRLLLEVGKALRKDEVKDLAFLCTDLLGQNPTSVESANDLFSRLADQDYLSPEHPHLLTELLTTIKRTRLVRDLALTDRDSATSSLISPYRKLLYSLSEEITDDDLNHVKFLLNKTLPRRKLEDNVTTLEVFLEMEHMDLLSDTNLNELEKMIQSICPMLKEKINQFKALPGKIKKILIANVTANNKCKNEDATADVRVSKKTLPQTSIGTVQEFSGLGYSESSFITFLDLPDVLGEDENGALSHGLSGLHTETSSCTSLEVRRDALGLLLSQEHETSPEELIFQATNTNSEDLGIYPMTAAKRGFCLIVNNNNFSESNLKNREGTMIDEKCLHDVFKWLGFEIETRRDCTSRQMLSVLQELGRRDHSQMDCVVCCVLSHGQQGGVCGVDGNNVKLMELMEPLNGVMCPSLATKPKLFFIQACQGTREQRAVYVEADGIAHSPVSSDAVVANNSIPCDADFLQAMATVPFFASFRERKNGTWFIQSLCQNLVQMVPRGIDLVSILTKVNADVSERSDFAGKKKQMPQPAFSLRKKVVFPIPEARPPSLLSHTSDVP
uniref:Caspase-8 n=1 Tax=Seriola lalandi dorsalis TaxID=1841481 RepID=A0A3B4WAC5_SERLL